MNSNANLTNLLPVACPVCRETQNTVVGGFDPDGMPAGEVLCMVCRHLFTQDEYLRGMEMREREFSMLKGPKS